jgi:D-beta-D-heptose 7-phosphate kinase / D-beta-D-heptose 1-phosphate adenosyltransferase
MTPELLAKIKNARVAVIGDLMIDEYLTGDVTRISPEAPVPVVRGVALRSVAGGAANVAANIGAIGATAILVGVIGNDGGRAEIEAILRPFGSICLDFLAIDSTRRTTRKKRILAQQQQIVRIDYEDTDELPTDTQDEIITKSIKAIKDSHVVALSDYGKGVLGDRVVREIIDCAKSLGKTIIVDPKRSTFTAYRGASILTPNRTELSRATGLPAETDQEVEAAASKAQAQFGGELLLTRSEKGMSFFPRSGPPAHIPTVARQVFDVSGAGDTVVAVLATAIAAGSPAIEAVKMANHAAGLVVGKAGTATLSPQELPAVLSVGKHVEERNGRLASHEDAMLLRRAWREQGFSVGFANGCFDLLHPGHVSLIRQAARACDRLIVALNSDASVRRLKGPTRPVQTQEARADVIGALRGVDLVVFFDEDTPLELIKNLEPDVLIKGSDYTVDRVVGGDIVRARGGSVLLADLVAGQSTTRMLRDAR